MSNSPSSEPRYDCPVCVGLPMQKLTITHKHQGIYLTLDCCKRCGGVWFDQGEVKLSQQIASPNIQQRIAQHSPHGQSYCPSCHGFMDRNLENCDQCGWRNQISCPVCEQPLQIKKYNHLTVDACERCQGVWLDQADLSALWQQSLRSQVGALPQEQKPQTLPTTTPADQSQPRTNITAEIAVEGAMQGGSHGAESLLLDSGVAQYMTTKVGQIAKGTGQIAANSPEIADGAVESLAEVTGAALESLGALPEITTVIFEVAGGVAGGIVEALGEVIASLF